MKKSVLAVIAVFSVALCAPVHAEDHSRHVSTDTKVIWPDYHSSSWTVANAEMLLVPVRVSLENNSSVFGPGQYNVRVGTVTTIMDSKREETAKLIVVEVDILSVSSVVRAMYMNGMPGHLARQVMIKGEWKDVPADAGMEIGVDNSEGVVRKNEAPVVTLIVKNESGELMRVTVGNKPQVKSKKK